MDLVIKETLRLYPSVPLFGRKLKEDFVMRKQINDQLNQLIIMISQSQADCSSQKVPALELHHSRWHEMNHSGRTHMILFQRDLLPRT